MGFVSFFLQTKQNLFFFFKLYGFQGNLRLCLNTINLLTMVIFLQCFVFFFWTRKFNRRNGGGEVEKAKYGGKVPSAFQLLQKKYFLQIFPPFKKCHLKNFLRYFSVAANPKNYFPPLVSKKILVIAFQYLSLQRFQLILTIKTN